MEVLICEELGENRIQNLFLRFLPKSKVTSSFDLRESAVMITRNYYNLLVLSPVSSPLSMAKFCNLVRSSPFYNTSLVVVCIDVSSTDLYKIQRIFSNHRMIIGDSIYFEKFENDIRNEVIQFYKKERN